MIYHININFTLLIFNNIMTYSNLSLKELKQLCKNKNIKKYSSKNKSELIKLLNNYDINDKKIENDTSNLNNEIINNIDNNLENLETLPNSYEIDNIKEKEVEINNNVKLIHGDCLEKLKLIDDDSIHLILTDLPYGSTKCKWDSIIDLNKLWIEFTRILIKPTGVVVLFGQQPFTSKLISSNYDWFKYNLIWKKNKTTQYLLANYRPMKCTEDICIFSPGGAAAASKHRGNMTYNPQGLVSCGYY
jgi:hypothetical protein